MSKGLIKSEEELKALAEGGRTLGRILAETAARVQPGISTAELNDHAARLIREAGATPAFQGYGSPKNPFPAALCTSVNDVVVHGIPNRDEILKEGDIIGLDLGIIWKQLVTDAAVTVAVGKVDAVSLRLIAATRRALEQGVAAARPGNRVGAISHAIQTAAEGEGFSVVRAFVGHGVGRTLHEDPPVPCYGEPENGVALLPGMVIAIEPMVVAGNFHVKVAEDGWTARTKDGSRAAHFEHSVAITEEGPEILTRE